MVTTKQLFLFGVLIVCVISTFFIVEQFSIPKATPKVCREDRYDGVDRSTDCSSLEKENVKLLQQLMELKNASPRVSSDAVAIEDGPAKYAYLKYLNGKGTICVSGITLARFLFFFCLICSKDVKKTPARMKLTDYEVSSKTNKKCDFVVIEEEDSAVTLFSKAKKKGYVLMTHSDALYGK